MKESLLNQLKNIPIQDCYEDYFKSIAKNMFMNYCIKKGDETYYFTSLEFYFCHNNHFDMITYPRNTEAGQWFFHQSGVDLTFKSHFTNNSKFSYKPSVSLKDDYAYGGILIKEVVKKGGDTWLKGPSITMWELFDVINAFPIDYCRKDNKQVIVNVQNWPVIAMSEGFDNIEPKSLKRVLRLNDNESINKKFQNLNKDIYNSKLDIKKINEFNSFVLKDYRFEISKDYYDYR